MTASPEGHWDRLTLSPPERIVKLGLWQVRAAAPQTGGGIDLARRKISRAAPCLICGEPDSTVTHFWAGGRVAPLHAACDAVWKQEKR